MTLHPQSRALLDIVHRPGVVPFHELPIEQMRRDAQKLQFAYRPPAPEVASASKLVLRRQGGPDLPARCYRPLGSLPAERLPLLLWFHGGGWTVGDLASYDVLCRELANGAGCAVLSIGYRLAPEHKFPAAVEDACFAVRWAAANADLLAIDPDRMAVGGDSAGGNLATVAALLLRDLGGAALRFQLLVYPATDQRGLRDSHARYAEGYLLTQPAIRRFQAAYLSSEAQRSDWRASPLLAPDLAGLPPALVLAAEYDPLVDDCLAYRERLQASGVEADWSCYAGMVHGFFTLGGFLDDGNRAVAEAAAALAQALREAP